MATPTREDIRRWDIEHVWHPFTQMAEYEAAGPFVVVAAEGHDLIDDAGDRYFDATSALWCNLFGHRVPAIDAAIRDQLQRLAHTTLLGTTHPAAAILARRLIDIAPAPLRRVFYSDDGATAVESALKIAFQFFLMKHGAARAERATYLSLDNGYHGDTLGAAAVGGVALFHQVFRPILLPALKAPAPYCYRCPLKLRPASCNLACAQVAEEILAREHERLCAFLVEPGLQAAAGMLVLPKGYLARLARACKQYDVLLVLDEVATGFGRTGALFACEAEGVAPDLLCLAKGLTGGYLPIAATLATDDIYNVFLGKYEEYRHFFHGHTYTGNALGCAAAIATLDLLADGEMIRGVAPKAARLAELLAPLAAHARVGDIRRLGLMCGIELVQDRATKTPFEPHERIGYRVCLAMRRHRVFARPLGDVLVLMLPLSVKDEEIERVAAAVHAAIREVLG
ncbi:MAG: adenosylmethionine--8-amino-7-oxononanoate transaminase [Vicinamibacteria bacterium]|jgi:adenosylmethionine-8-amino-7-oxononanoate aminotransferase|nr:adenosylmethionine--8-amino-7-oxononanoate transaminase [Vicinamibacteria bacterium]